MSPALRRGLANHVLDAIFHEVLWESGRVELRQWLAQPELGFFTLKGEVGPGKQPELNFLVRKHIPPNNSYVESGWGWQVNSSSLGD